MANHWQQRQSRCEPPPERRPVAHVFHRSAHTTGGIRDEPLCAQCGNAESHRVHDVPESPPEVAELEARRLGEGIE